MHEVQKPQDGHGQNNKQNIVKMNRPKLPIIKKKSERKYTPLTCLPNLTGEKDFKGRSRLTTTSTSSVNRSLFTIFTVNTKTTNPATESSSHTVQS